MKNYKKLVLNDFRGYRPETSRNGGDYAFFTYYDLMSDGNFVVSYGTSSDMQFCPCCGTFSDHSYDEETNRYECGEFQVLSKDELVKLIRETDETEDYYYDVES